MLARLTHTERVAVAAFLVIAALSVLLIVVSLGTPSSRPSPAQVYVADLTNAGVTAPTVAEVDGSMAAICGTFTSGQPVNGTDRVRSTDYAIVAALRDSRLCGSATIIVPPTAVVGA